MNAKVQRRVRKAARLYVLDPAERLLLFRFDPPGQDSFWATPGGEVGAGESFADAARRELFEETGFRASPDELGEPIASRRDDFTAHWGEDLTADERYYLVHASHSSIDKSGFEPIEREIMSVHRWWTLDEISRSTQTIYPRDILEMVKGALKP